MEYPDFPLPESQGKSWSQQELKQYWERTLQKPPQDMLLSSGTIYFGDRAVQEKV